jgi:hypothetical protein
MGIGDLFFKFVGWKKESPAGGVKVIKNQVTLQFFRSNVDTANMAGLVNSVNSTLNPLQRNKQIDNFTIDSNQQRGGGPALVVTIFTDASRQMQQL